jgi:hypothetical protein
MEAVCTRKGWAYGEGDTAKALIKICLDNDLIPPFSQNQLAALRSLLESGVPTVRKQARRARAGARGTSGATPPG